MAGEFVNTTYGRFSAAMKEDRLASVCVPDAGVQTGPFGSQLHQEDYVETGTPIITVEHLGENRILQANLPRVSDEDRDRLSKYQMQDGDIIFSRVGSVDRRALVRSTEGGWLFSGRCLRVRPDRRKIDPAYLSYFFGLPTFKAHIRSIAVGATMPSLNTQILSDVPILYPEDVDVQRAIAHILGTIDDKIELNRRMNETLESIARAMFKSWFVDFDPVRAKMNNEPPESICRRLGLTPDLLALFPDRLVDSELGEIPVGWEVGSFGDVAHHPRRGIQPDQIAEDTPYIALEHMPKRCIALSDWGLADGLESNKFEFKKGEILFGKLRPYFQKVGVAPVDGVCSTDIVVITPKAGEWFGFVLGHASSDAFVEYTNAGSTGTKMPRTSWADMSRYSLVIPSVMAVSAYTNFMSPLIERMIASIHEARTLAALRDSLLPKLLSGELRVVSH